MLNRMIQSLSLAPEADRRPADRPARPASGGITARGPRTGGPTPAGLLFGLYSERLHRRPKILRIYPGGLQPEKLGGVP